MKIENTIETVTTLCEILKKNNLSEISIQDGSFSMSIAAKPDVMQSVGVPQTVAATQVEVPKEADGNIVRSPIIGTYYSAASPQKPAFVSVGSKVNKGDILCIVESMKLMNEIVSDFTGTVAEFFVQSGDGVEYQQPLIRIE